MKPKRKKDTFRRRRGWGEKPRQERRGKQHERQEMLVATRHEEEERVMVARINKVREAYASGRQCYRGDNWPLQMQEEQS